VTGCSPAGIVPSKFVKLSVSVVADDVVFANANPLLMLPGKPVVPKDSTYTRDADEAVTGTPVSEIVACPVEYEKITSGTGASAPAEGMI
jgi:hypothetical protein